MAWLPRLAVSALARASALPKALCKTPQRGLLWSTLTPPERGGSNIKWDQHGFRIKLDVQHFKPDELKVKIVDDYLVVEGKHEDQSDKDCFVSRQFTRCYKIPEGVNMEDFESTLSADGVLMLHAPSRPIPEANVRHIPIKQVGDKMAGDEQIPKPQQEEKVKAQVSK